MRIKTKSNTLLIEGLLDTKENKKIWANLGPKALSLAQQVRDQRPKDIKVAAVYSDAYLFSNSAKGIIQQALSGGATVFKANAEKIISLDEKFDSGVGYCLIGALYTVAPWPIGNLKLAEQFMDKALKVAKSRRNHYYVGVVAFRQKVDIFR